MNSYLQINNVSFSIKDKTILNNINLSLNKNEFTSLIGHNGSGKTTLSKIIMGILKPSSGNILVDDINVEDMSLAKIGSKIGYLFQNPNRQIFAPTVHEELIFAYRFTEFEQQQLQKNVEEMLVDFELEHLRESKTYFLSQGEKQRVALASILLNNPEYLILDEPTTGLDQIRKTELSKIFNKIMNRNLGILMISHDLDFVNKHSNRIIELDRGCLINDQEN